MQFSIVSKIIRDCIGYALLRFVIGPKHPSHSPNQSNAKLTNHESVARVFPPFPDSKRYFPFFRLADEITLVFI